MHKRKLKIKARRRARKRQNQAWEAAAAGNLDRACKELQRALQDCQENPEIWNGYGVLLHQAGDPEQAEHALRNAIFIAPSYAEAYANLASLVSQLGRTIQAERLQRQAVELAPEDPIYRARLETYRVLVPEPQEAAPAAPETSAAATALWSPRIERYDWAALEEELTERGCALLTELLTAEECRKLRDLFTREECFEKTVPLPTEAGGEGAYRFFRRPLPELVAQLRGAIYARLAPIVDRWSERLGQAQRWPAAHETFLERCALAGQTRTTPILLRYRAPAVNALHQDVWGEIYFPLQLAVTLSPRAAEGGNGFSGGAFVLADDGAGRKARRLEIATSLGDAVVFCTRERLVRIGKTYAYQPVLHGMAPLEQGERYVLGIPFHDYSDGGKS